VLSTTVKAAEAQAQNCIGAPIQGGDGVVRRSLTAPSSGWIAARLEAGSGDWDLGLFDQATGKRVAGGSSLGASEVASGLAARGQELTLQACRRSGEAVAAKITVDATAIDPDAKVERASLVRVSTPNRDRKDQLTNLGLDLTEHAGREFVEVVLHGADDAAELRKAKFVFTTEVRDLAVADDAHREADARFAQRVRASALPSKRTKYRALADYTMEMKRLAEQNPDIVKSISLPFKTYEGRTVEGIEITEDVDRRDGKPVFLQMGVHHAREWPAGEHAMEWAYELVNGYKANNPRVRNLMGRTRTIVIPIVNPDGFNHSRTRGTAAAEGPGGGRGAPNPGQEDETDNILSNPNGEYRRKNCRLADDSASGNCDAAFAAGLTATGVDPNRNYGGLWGGPGASESNVDDTYRGPGPFSEPETKNIKDLVSKRQVTTLITNHTFSDLVLRPPGLQSLGDPPDENRGYKALGDAMAAENGYLSQKSFQLYDTTGTTEDWSYGATGGYGFTFEIGCTEPTINEESGEKVGCDQGHFHPPYSEVIKEYEGDTTRSDETRDGKGNREAYFIALESTANSNRHSVIAGDAPSGAVLRLKKSFKTKTSPVLRDGEETDIIEFEDNLDTTVRVGGTGLFEWHINPSTRPDVAIIRGRAKQGEPSPKVTFDNSPASAPDGAVPNDDANSNNSLNYKDHVFQVPANGGGVDNAKFTARIDWTTPGTDWDTRLFRDSNANGTVDAGEPQLGSSQTFATDFEQITVGEPYTPGQYIFRVNNFAASEPYQGKVTFQSPTLTQAIRERWTLTCETDEGRVRTTQQVLIDRNQSKPIDFGSACPRTISANAGLDALAFARRTCLSPRKGIRSRSVGPAVLSRTRARQRRILRRPRLKSGKNIDRYCVVGGGILRAGYPTRRLNAGMSSRSRKRIRRRAVLAISTSRRLRLRKLRVGSRTRTLRKRLKGERRVRVGRNVWYTARGKRSRLLFRTSRGRVRELGLGNKRLTTTRRGTVRFLRAWDRRGL